MSPLLIQRSAHKSRGCREADLLTNATQLGGYLSQWTVPPKLGTPAKPNAKAEMNPNGVPG